MTTAELTALRELKVLAPVHNNMQEILTDEALAFLVELHKNFNERRKSLLVERAVVQKKLDRGWKPTFLEETKNIREEAWEVAPLPQDLLDRRVEITGPVDRKMVINALNAGAKVFMADFEDSNSPSWENVITGQVNLKDAIDRTISFENPKSGKLYTLNKEVATLMVRPRGLHLEESHIQVGGENMSGSLVDFGLYFFHNAHTLLQNGSGPYFYLPKLEHYFEARWWNDVFVFVQEYLSIPKGTIKATVLVETILASFQLNEILFELRQHSAGLNCGRWDYIFSFIKRFHNQTGFVFPDRDQVNMEVSFMESYSMLVIQTCHKRGVHAMGGMAAQIPIKGDDEANAAAFEKVRNDKLREVKNGHDGTWVAHPGLVPVAMEVFNTHMPQPNQIENKVKYWHITEENLIDVPQGTITEKGVRKNINVGIQYIAAWLSGNGAAAINHLMEDAATAEISRTQLWQWLRMEVSLSNGKTLTSEMYYQLFEEELQVIKNMVNLPIPWKEKLGQAATLFDSLIRDKSLKEFLTLDAYEMITERENTL